MDSKIKSWLNQLFVVEWREVFFFDEMKIISHWQRFWLALLKSIFYIWITSASNILLILSSFLNKAIISEGDILMSRP